MGTKGFIRIPFILQLQKYIYKSINLTNNLTEKVKTLFLKQIRCLIV